MKIELMKETKGGNVIYWVTSNGKFIEGSVRTTEKDANEVFNEAVAKRGVLTKREVIKTVEVI